jgi:hypothetical protein
MFNDLCMLSSWDLYNGESISPCFLMTRESQLVPGKETGFQKSCVQYSGVYQESNAFQQLGKMLPGRLLGRSIVHPPQSYSLQGMY